MEQSLRDWVHAHWSALRNHILDQRAPAHQFYCPVVEPSPVEADDEEDETPKRRPKPRKTKKPRIPLANSVEPTPAPMRLFERELAAFDLPTHFRPSEPSVH